MKPDLIRTYFPPGTNGKILYQGRLIVYIELPRKNNHTRVSCIPGGGYEWVKRCFARRSHGGGGSPKSGMQELKGCIAPGSLISAAGKGTPFRAGRERTDQSCIRGP